MWASFFIFSIYTGITHSLMAFCFQFCLPKRSITWEHAICSNIHKHVFTYKENRELSTLTTSQLKTQATLKYTAFQIHVLFMCIFLFQKHSCRDSTFPSRNKNTNSTTSVSKLLKKRSMHEWGMMNKDLLSKLVVHWQKNLLTYTHTQFL